MHNIAISDAKVPKIISIGPGKEIKFVAKVPIQIPYIYLGSIKTKNIKNSLNLIDTPKITKNDDK